MRKILSTLFVSLLVLSIFVSGAGTSTNSINDSERGCTTDVKQCDDGSYTSRDPNNNC